MTFLVIDLRVILQRHDDPCNEVEQNSAAKRQHEYYPQQADESRIYIEVLAESRADAGDLSALVNSNQSLCHVRTAPFFLIPVVQYRT